MIDYSSWPRRFLSITSLKLDDRNPRLPDTPDGKPLSQPKIIEYLVDYEGAYELAKKIAAQGYFPNEEPIVCKENKKTVVLEGNRRVCACKILLNPDLLKGATKRKTINKLLRDFDIAIIKKLHVRQAPNRESADVIIVNRHTEGAEIEKWDKTRQDKFFYLRYDDGESLDELSSKFAISTSALKDGIIRHNVYVEMKELELPNKVRKDLENESKFPMTNVERFYKSKEGKEFLCIEFDEKGRVKHKLPKEEFAKRLTKIVIDTTEKRLNSRSLGDEDARKKYLSELTSNQQFDLTIQPNIDFESEYTTIPNKEEEVEEQTKEKKVVDKKPAAKHKLFPDSLNWVSGYTRIDAIFGELKKANLNTQFNSAAILLRSYLDMVVYQYLLKVNAVKDILIADQRKLDEDNSKRLQRVSDYIKSLNIDENSIKEEDLKKAIKSKTKIPPTWVPGLKQMLSHLAKSETLLPDVKLRQALGGYLKGNDNFLGHNDFNLFVHNEYFVKNVKELKVAFNQMHPILDYIIDKIK